MFIIAGLYRHQRLDTPKGKQTRPTSNRLREALFNICQQNIEDAHFLDIFAGSGAIGLEAISRGAQSSTFIEINREAIHCIKNNIARLKVQKQCHVLFGEAFAMLQLLQRKKKKFDIIYADPPYRTPLPGLSVFYSTQMIQWIDYHPLLVSGGLFFIEEDAHFQPQLNELQTLTFIKSRCLGKSMLQQYRKI